MNRIVTLTSSTYYNKEVVGTFPLIEVTKGDSSCKRDCYVRILKDGKPMSVQVWNKDMHIAGESQAVTLSFNIAPPSDDEISAVIRKRFQLMDRMVEGLVMGNVQALIVSAAPGVGKTFTLEKRLNLALKNNEIKKFSHLRGKITTLGLYTQLYHHRNKGDVLAFDDMDSVFSEEDRLNFLKVALDTGSRILSYPSGSSWFQENGIPNEFDFQGTVVFITNKDFDRVIEKGGSMAEHFKALISRSNYMDLKVHTNKEILIRVKQVIEDTDILKEQDLTQAQGEQILKWMEKNHNKMREISIRSILKLASYMKTDGNDWEDVADMMMLMS